MIRGRLFLLFLYILLAWFIVLLFNEPDNRVRQGIIWSAVGVASLFIWLVLEQAIGWWRVRRAQAASRVVKPVAPVEPTHVDDVALVNLLNEADRRLAQAPGAPGVKPATAVEKPFYLILGPGGAGKTALLHNSGIEPSLLAGQVTGGSSGVTSTRLANLWLVEQSVFLEVGGPIFSNEPTRFAKFLRVLRPGANTEGWRAWFQPPRKPILLRSVLLVLDSREFLASPEPSKLDRLAQQVRERLSVVAGFLNVELPVYALFTHLDAVPHFAEFFARLSEGESSQVFGVLTPSGPPLQNQVWAEVETKRLNRLFQSLFLRLSDWRLLALTKEQEAQRKQAIYEFPREFKKIRTPLVQFLVDVFKPDPLKAGPGLQGFFFTGVRKTERSGTPDPQTESRAFGTESQPTRMFEAELTKLPPKAGSGALVDRWIFVTDFFHKVLSQDKASVRIVAPASKWEQYRKVVVATAAGLGILLSVIWTISFVGNNELITKTAGAIWGVQRKSRDLSLESLQALDGLRGQLMDLERRDWSLHWGLYKGESLRLLAHKVYFERLKQLSLDRINRILVLRLQRGGEATRGVGNDPIYELLKTHRTITTTECTVDRPLISKVLKEAAVEDRQTTGEEQIALLRAQLDFYVSQLERYKALPVQLSEDEGAVKRAREYLRQSGGLEQQVQSLLNELSQRMKPAPVKVDFQSVMTGAAEYSTVFTKEGLAEFKGLLSEKKFPGSGEKCVVGESPGSLWSGFDPRTREQMENLYYRQYAKEWQTFLGSYKVKSFGAGDAAQRLSKLGNSPSPLLEIVKLVSRNTNFPPAKPEEATVFEKSARVFQQKAKIAPAAALAKQVSGSNAALMTAEDVNRMFQPAQDTAAAEGVLVNQNNKAYVEGLRALGVGFEDLGRAAEKDKLALFEKAREAYKQADSSHKGLTDKFDGDPVVKRLVSELLYQPIKFADPLLPAPGKVTSGAKDKELRAFCGEMSQILTKYPFNPTGREAALSDLRTAFVPNEGLVWKYAQGSELVIRPPGQQWQPNPAWQGPKVTRELVAFLNHAQKVTNAFFGEGTTPRLQYELRPAPRSGSVVRLTLDGKELSSEDSRKRFSWPAAPGRTPGGEGNVDAPGHSSGFARFSGPWGVFKLFQIADPRQDGNKTVVWSEIRGRGDSEPQKIVPPASVDFTEFPGGVDVFNPKFFENFQCPKKAVAPQ